MNMDKKMYIGGELVDGSAGSFDVVSPATESAVGKVAWANAADASKALAAADAAFASWSATPVAERCQWMAKLREAVIASEEHLRECIHLEMGKTWGQSKEDFDSLINSLAFYAEEIAKRKTGEIADREGTHEHQLIEEPAGVVAAFLAWNFPLLNLAFKIGPAMAAGCPIVIKPSFKSPLSAYAIGELCHQIGLPAGVVNIVCGDDEEVGDALSSSTIPAVLTLIGSVRTARRIMAKGATSVKRYSLELGGNAPVLVLADADQQLAADIVCAVKFGVAGQICVTPNRVFVNESIADNYRDEVVKRAMGVKVGFDRDSDADMGPVIDKTAWERIDGLVKEAIADGAELLCGGGRPEGVGDTGFYYAPTVLDKVTPQMRIYREEIFGPVVSLIRFADEDEALRQANDTTAGLTAYVFTADKDKAQDLAGRLRFGEIQINGVKYDIYLPHVGIKQSGVGCDCSHLALDDYLVTKRVTRALAA